MLDTVKLYLFNIILYPILILIALFLVLCCIVYILGLFWILVNITNSLIIQIFIMLQLDRSKYSQWIGALSILITMSLMYFYYVDWRYRCNQGNCQLLTYEEFLKHYGIDYKNIIKYLRFYYSYFSEGR
jgi:hypothetical protein